MAASRPNSARASVRATITRSPSILWSTAALDLLDHLGLLDHGLPGKVAASLREHLVLKLNAAGARLLELLDRARHIDCVAEPGIGIHQERQIDHVPDGAGTVDQLLERHQADIGHAEVRVGDTRAGDIDAVETQFGDDSCRQGVGGTGQDRGVALRQELLQADAMPHGLPTATGPANALGNPSAVAVVRYIPDPILEPLRQ